MENTNFEKKCAHPPCNCQPENGSDYCSPQCEKAFEETDCSCGHVECHAEG